MLKSTCTADDMRPLAQAAGFAPGVWKWKEDERADGDGQTRRLILEAFDRMSE